MEIIKRCGNCIHARIVPENIQQRICRGMPPQVIALPHPQGIQIKHMFPVVMATDESCGQYERLIVVDVTNGEIVE